MVGCWYLKKSLSDNGKMMESDELIVYDVELSEFINRKMPRLNATSNFPFLSETINISILKRLQVK